MVRRSNAVWQTASQTSSTPNYPRLSVKAAAATEAPPDCNEAKNPHQAPLLLGQLDRASLPANSGSCTQLGRQDHGPRASTHQEEGVLCVEIPSCQQGFPGALRDQDAQAAHRPREPQCANHRCFDAAGPSGWCGRRSQALLSWLEINFCYFLSLFSCGLMIPRRCTRMPLHLHALSVQPFLRILPSPKNDASQ